MERRANSELRERVECIVVLVAKEMVPWQVAGDCLERAGVGTQVIRRVLAPYTRSALMGESLSFQLGFSVVPRWLKQ